jgi:hypothetical protein
MWQRLAQVMRELSADDAVRCVVLRGAGGKAFAPGNDIAQFETERSNFAQGKAYGAILHDALGAIADCRHPTVAMAPSRSTRIASVILFPSALRAAGLFALGAARRLIDIPSAPRAAGLFALGAARRLICRTSPPGTSARPGRR